MTTNQTPVTEATEAADLMPSPDFREVQRAVFFIRTTGLPRRSMKPSTYTVPVWAMEKWLEWNIGGSILKVNWDAFQIFDVHLEATFRMYSRNGWKPQMQYW